MARTPTVSIVLVNWNHWRDTVECLRSIFRSNYQNLYVVVCDNASTDGSLRKIQQWAERRHEDRCLSEGPPSGEGECFPSPSVVRLKPVEGTFAKPLAARSLVLIQNSSNLGFAGGNNMGIRFALNSGTDYIWLLNNDTVIEPNACSELVARMEADSGIGICGATLLDFSDRKTIQTRGGCRYNRWSARITPVRSYSENGLPAEGRMDYVAGASMFVRRSFIERVGVMEESYFLYFEELNWSIRGRSSSRLGYCAAAKVYHKESQSIGAAAAGRRSLTAEYYSSRNRLRITWQFWPWCVPTVLLSLAASAIHRAIHGRWRQAAYIAAGVFGVPPERLSGLQHLADPKQSSIVRVPVQTNV